MWISTARAAPPSSGPPPLPRPAHASAMVLGGVDAWTGGGGPATELRAGAVASPVGGLWLIGSTATELVSSNAELLALDQHGGEVGLAGRGRWAPRVSASTWGSAGLGWLDGEVAAGVVARPGSRSRLDATVAGGLRAADVVGPTGSARLGADLKLGPTTLSSRLRGTVLGGDLPPAILGAEQWLSIGTSTSATAGLVVTGVPAAPLATPVAGVPVPGTTVLQGILATDVHLVERLQLHLEVAPEGGFGAAPYARIRALAGLSADLSKRPPSVPRAVGQQVRFEHRAPRAETVELLAEFDGWEPVPMTREGGRWTVQVEVPPGSWEFSYRVDGEVVVPLAAERYVPDGFGGTNAVVVVER